MTFERARRIADAVLLEGYVLYPYRASSAKNRWRFPFGVLAPRAWSEAGGCEPWWLEAQCLVEPSGSTRLRGRLRFLRARRRRVEARDGGGALRPVEVLDTGGRLEVAWDEAEVRELDFEAMPGADATVPLALDGTSDEEPIVDAAGTVAGRVVRATAALSAGIQVRWERAAADRLLWRLSVRVENGTPWASPGAPRDAVLPASCLATHLLLAIEGGGGFVSLVDPPGWARTAAAACRSTRAWPVLAGEEGERDLVLASPIILYDHPRVAPESPGDFFDACEIDELLALRTATLTEEERREARATDPRAAAVVDRVAALPPELVERLHGATRDLRGAEMAPRPAEAAGAAAIRPGERVRLRPGARRTDAQDLLFAGCTATVRAIHRDVEDREWLAVTIDDDPAAELHDWYGRYHYYRDDEVEPLPPAEVSP